MELITATFNTQQLSTCLELHFITRRSKGGIEVGRRTYWLLYGRSFAVRSHLPVCKLCLVWKQNDISFSFGPSSAGRALLAHGVEIKFCRLKFISSENPVLNSLQMSPPSSTHTHTPHTPSGPSNSSTEVCKALWARFIDEKSPIEIKYAIIIIVVVVILLLLWNTRVNCYHCNVR